MNKTYKPYRPVTTEKIKRLITIRLNGPGSLYKRVFRRKLIMSKGTIRGYIVPSFDNTGRYKEVIAISDPNDTEILELYYVNDCKYAATSLGIEEILTSE